MDAARAIEFYAEALGAREVVRYVNKKQATVSHADLAIGAAMFSVTEEARAWNSDAPPSLGGSPGVLQLRVDDVDAAFEIEDGMTVGELRPRGQGRPSSPITDAPSPRRPHAASP